MKRNSLSCLMGAVVVMTAMSFQTKEADAGIFIGIGRGHVYTPYSYYAAPPAYYYNPPVMITSQRHPYYAVPQPVVQTTYYTQPVYRPQPVYYAPAVVAPAPYYHPRGEYEYKVKYRRGLFHDSVEYEFDYDD